jgi:acetyl esterase/lipase
MTDTFYSFGSPVAYRAASVRLARMTKARVASIKYRLSPNNTFPAAILDTLIAYASLISPPAGAPWSAVPADKIVLAGNSAGSNLELGLTKFLLEWAKISPTSEISDFHGHPLILSLPAGIASVSGWCDPCDALPSWHANGEYDILGVLQPVCMPNHPTDSLWPTTPPREHPYCVAATLDHELICPAAVRDWHGAPPMWFACGSEERGVDGNRVVASQAAKSGVTVIWNEYEGMLHDFPLIMGKLPQAKHAMISWAHACMSMTTDDPSKKLQQSSATSWLMPDCKNNSMGDPRNLSPLPFGEIRKKMKEYNATRPVWTGKLGVPRL